MAFGRCTAIFVSLFLTLASAATPISKVIDLITGLKTEVEDEGKAEATSYDKYACFCKKTTEDKSKNVKGLDKKINFLSALIADKTQARKDDITELGERKAKQEKLSLELDETIARCAKDKAEYDATNADLTKAISSLKSAIKAMKESMPSAAALIAIKTDVVNALSSKALTDRTSSVSILAVMTALKARVDPSDPEYEYHSGDIIKLCEGLLEEFKTDKSSVDAEWEKTSKACTDTKKSLKEEMASNKKAMDNLDKEIESLAEEIAKARGHLVEAEEFLKDDKQYLEDLGAQCEERAKDYDQRSQMRADELGALTSALKILENDTKSADEAANQRALLLQTRKAKPETRNAAAAKLIVAPSKPLSFVQEALVKQHSQGFLSNSNSLEAKRNRALSVLQSEARRIGSLAISALVVRVRADPFKKVKGLIQKLIERLLEESKAEATKKGFCDTSLKTAQQDRDARFTEANDLSRELKALEATKDELEEEIETLTKDIKEEKDLHGKTLKDRETEKEENAKTIKTAKEGLASVTEALAILKEFYSSAAKAAALVQASPVDEDTSGPGFSGSYKGKQGGMKAVFSLLEVIQSDFDRTIRKTEEAEHEAHRDFVKFSQSSQADTGSMETKKELDEQDLESTKTAIKTKFDDLQAATNLLDSALKELEELKPACMDSGMSYKERVEKREAEMEALKTALCILDTDKVEADCALA